MTPSPEDRAMATADAPAEHQNQQYPLARQPSLLSLTLEEVQNTMCEPGKNFGSMNMDEFLTNIWTVEEGNAMGGAAGGGCHDPGAGQIGIYRQGSRSLPSPLCRKTVDEVWSEIHRDNGHHLNNHQYHQHQQQQQYANSGNAPRQPTFGEMTLEDFLIKAGVVREDGYGEPLDQGENERPGYSNVLGTGYGDLQHNGVYHRQQQGGGVVTSSSNSYGGGGGVSYGGRMENGYGAHRAEQQQEVRLVSPVSPVSSDGLSGSQVDNNPNGRWGAEMGVVGGAGLRGIAGNGGGRKRILDGPVEKVVERRQRRMIKNRESAARSRARKQAYTVELEAELNQLREENAQLQEEQRRLAEKKRQMLLECMAQKSRTNEERNANVMRRSTSCVW